MPITVTSKGGSDFEPIPTGVHQAVCYGIVDIGTQQSKNPQHGAKRKLVIIWELPHERADFGEDKKNLPRAISQTYTQSLNTKAILRKDLESWRGRPFTEAELLGFDPKVLIGVNCLLNIVHDTKSDKTYANIKAVTPLAKGMTKMPQENKSLYFSLDDQKDLKNLVFPDNMPNWLREKTAFSAEVIAAHGGGTGEGVQQHPQEQSQAAPDRSQPAHKAPAAPAPQENLDEDVPF